MEDVRITEIAKKVFELTQSNKLKWSTSNKPEYFITNIGNQNLAIFSTGARFVFEVYDSNTNLLGSINEQNRYSIVIPNITNYYSLVSLYESAKKSALNIDKNLNDLLNNLNNL